MSESPTYTKDAGDVIQAEKKYLTIDKRKTGLAISGGGIRSASFGLGVMQALVANKQLSKIDYMSTVSGGGFLGSALTWALKQGGSEAGTTPDKFPLGKRGATGRLDKKGNELLDFIRQHGDYLTPTSSLGLLSFIGVILRSMLLSLVVYFSFMMVLIVALIWSGLLSTLHITDFLGFSIFGLAFKGYIVPIGIALFVLFLISSFIYSLRTFFADGFNMIGKYLSFIRGQKFIGYSWKLGLACFLIGSLPYFLTFADYVEKVIVASGSTVFGSLVGLWQYFKAQKGEKSNGALSNVVIYLGAFALIYGLLLLAFLVVNEYFVSNGIIIKSKALILLGISLIFGLMVNLNLIGPHRVWRNRLMEAYMPNRSAVKYNQWEPATEADDALMEEMCDSDNPRPYHLVNTNLILADSPHAKFKGRGGDNFIISRLYSGSDSTGWKKTDSFQRKGRRITLATAMATSAAAVNPNAAVSGEGVTRNSVVSILLSILNLRLGYWTTNPKKSPLPFPPNFFMPGLTSELTRSGLTEDRTNIQLSDGGHFENLALYELIRRKLDLIVLSDGGADPSFNFDDLANAIEKVRVDFGAKINFLEGYGLDNILPGTLNSNDFDKKYEIAKHGFAIAEIEYHDYVKGDPKPLLFYVKLAMIKNLPTDVYSYKGLHPEFPHQSTADQFFDEKQFEAYRELGYHIGWQMMESKKGKEVFV